MVFNLLQERQQIALNIKHQAAQAHQCCRCSAYNDWAGGRGTQPSLRTLSPAVFVQFWQPCLNIRTTSSAVFKRVSNAALSKKDGQCSSPTPTKHNVIFDLGMWKTFPSQCCIVRQHLGSLHFLQKRNFQGGGQQETKAKAMHVSESIQTMTLRVELQFAASLHWPYVNYRLMRKIKTQFPLAGPRVSGHVNRRSPIIQRHLENIMLGIKGLHIQLKLYVKIMNGTRGWAIERIVLVSHPKE